ncbi:MAG: glycosyltransferase involved in cell wall biosynthesis [Saprospiraceae bacterium]|jgi:glycosyltransferase involved in cell wall biosynthesis
MPKISAVILSKNEADRIGRCITSLINIVDEVMVVDSGSRDDTIKIAKSIGAKVISTEWKGFGETKNFGHHQAKNDWILSLDSDEWLSEELANEIMALKKTEKQVYSIDRSNRYMGKEIRYSGWSPDWVPRLFNRNEVKWNNSLVHEKLIIPKNYAVHRMSGKLMHDSYRSMEDHKAKTVRYAMLKAQSWIEVGKSPSFLKRYFGSSFKAFHSYVIKAGFLDGKEGMIIAKMNAYLVKMQVEYYDELKSQKL